MSPFGTLQCPSCSTALEPEKHSMNVEDILADIGDLMTELGTDGTKAEGAAPAKAEKPAAPPRPGTAADNLPKPRGSGEEEVVETYQCLVCGARIPADAGKCNICGTIFMSESMAKTFKGIPVSRINNPDEIEPDEVDIGQSHVRRSEEIPVELPLPKSGTLQELRQPEVMPQPVIDNNISKKTVVKKTILKKKANPL